MIAPPKKNSAILSLKGSSELFVIGWKATNSAACKQIGQIRKIYFKFVLLKLAKQLQARIMRLLCDISHGGYLAL
ncbi:MAG TPA: hypothetical protein DDZ21_03730 [Gammaproteobacteria bacterium]|nr:hypothetical protein [Gammaproteobacteria bacterium]HBJ89056.1 hypothetical protein [Gammaproteobacteria bacterium]HCA36710.1 hypothetical protein [Gammaproteobacteria bacterium]HCL71974.1 hypothetical protein [Gammaproteobacteria bacterium]